MDLIRKRHNFALLLRKQRYLTYFIEKGGGTGPVKP